MTVCTNREDILRIVEEAKAVSKSIGFVPTMGALHQGHISLVEKSLKQNNITIVSIFINPKQFNQSEDFEKYPRTLNKDIEILKKSGCSIVFVPSYEQVYQDSSSIEVNLDGLDTVLEGKFRKGHFQGVVDVVYRLFKIVSPNRAYFGKKDYQQLLIIKKMIDYFDFNIEIVPCEIIREPDGLALSSRNTRLSSTERDNAKVISEALFEAKKIYRNNQVNIVKNFVQNKIEQNNFLSCEYVEICDPDTLKPCSSKQKALNKILLTAVYCGKVRLIDNILLDSE